MTDRPNKSTTPAAPWLDDYVIKSDDTPDSGKNLDRGRLEFQPDWIDGADNSAFEPEK